MNEIELLTNKYFLECMILFRFIFLSIFIFSILLSFFIMFTHEKVTIYLWIHISIIMLLEYVFLKTFPAIVYFLILL